MSPRPCKIFVQLLFMVSGPAKDLKDGSKVSKLDCFAKLFFRMFFFILTIVIFVSISPKFKGSFC
jgi:hypothetical protein